MVMYMLIKKLSKRVIIKQANNKNNKLKIKNKKDNYNINSFNILNMFFCNL